MRVVEYGMFCVNDDNNVSQPTASNIISKFKKMGILKDYQSNIRSGWYVAVDVLPEDI